MKQQLSTIKGNVMDWTACSPDCNIKGHVWWILIHIFYYTNLIYTPVAEFNVEIQYTGVNLKQDALKILVDSMKGSFFLSHL